MLNLIKESIKVITLSVLVLFSIYIVSAAWTDPTVAPTGGNISVPLDASATGQSKAGGLILNTGGATNGLIISAGKVGIATSSPESALEVYGSTGAASQSGADIFRLYSVTTAKLLFGFDPITPFGSWIQSNSSYPILLNPVAGNVGVGTTSPSQKLSVGGTVYSSSGGFKFPDGTTQTSAATSGGFGGTYSKGGGSCAVANPLTGACTCLAGYTDQTLMTFSTNAAYSCGCFLGNNCPATGPCGSYSYEVHQCWR